MQYLIPFTDSDDHFLMIFEYANGGTLCDHLQERYDRITWEEKYKLALDIASGLKYLHDRDIIHKDMVCITMLQ